VDADDGPGSGTKLTDVTFADPGKSGYVHCAPSRRAFSPLVKAKRVTFFWNDDQSKLADVQFFRLGDAARTEVYAGGTTHAFTARRIAGETEIHPYLVCKPRFGEEDRIVYELTETPREHREPAKLPAGRQVHFLTPPIPEGTPVGAVRLDLKLGGVPAGNGLLVIVQDPLNRYQELLRFDGRMSGPRARLLLDFPDQLMPHAGLEIVARGSRKLTEYDTRPVVDAPARRLWLTLASEHEAEIDTDSTLEVLRVSPREAAAEHRAYRMMMLKGYQSMLSEQHPWSHLPWDKKAVEHARWDKIPESFRGPLAELLETLCDLHARFPRDPVVRRYWGWILLDRHRLHTPEDMLADPEPIPGVPQWALYQDRLAKTQRDIALWWITHRRAANGEFGGTENDDTCLMPHWVDTAMLNSALRPAVRTSCRGVVNNSFRYRTERGINKYTKDVAHAYEEGINQVALMPVLCVGDPRDVEHAFETSRGIEDLTLLDEQGRRRLVSYDPEAFGSFLFEKPRTPDTDHEARWSGYLHPWMILAWHHRMPHAIRLLEEMAPGLGFDRGLAYNHGWDYHFALWWTTENVAYLLHPVRHGEFNHRNAGSATIEYLLHGRAADEPSARLLADRSFWAGHENENVRWAMTRNRKELAGSLRDAWRRNRGYFHMFTEAEPFTDRVWMRTGILGQSALGGTFGRNDFWPAYAVSYDGLETDFAALVLDQGKDRLTVSLVNLAERPKTGAFRVWQLDHGRYKITVGPDENDDGETDSVLQTKTVELQRMDAVPVALPGRRQMIYRLLQTERLESIYRRADVAVSPDDVRLIDGDIEVTIHNIGNDTARDVTVALADAGGTVLVRATLDTLAAPTHFVAKTAKVRLPASPRAATVVLDPDDELPEILKTNNRAPLPGTR